MKTIKVKYKLMLVGFPCISNEFVIHEFKLKREYIDESEIIKVFNNNTLNTIYYMGYCGNVTEQETKAFVNYLENDNLIEFSIANKYNLNQNKVGQIITKYNMMDKINNIVTELRLILNIPIGIPIRIIEIYDQEENYIGKEVFLESCSFWDRNSYINTDEVVNNSRFHINSISSFYNIKNNRYQRALSFFNESFESNKVETRFTMLISSLESLFNYKLSSSDSIAKRVSESCANILTINNGNLEEMKKEIENMYNLRSRYLHGDNNIISLEDEKKLRKIVRIIIIFYSMVVIDKNYETSEMIQYINNPTNIECTHRLLLQAIMSNSFKEQQLGILNMVKEYVEVPEKFEKSILSYLKNNK